MKFNDAKTEVMQFILALLQAILPQHSQLVTL